MRGAREGALDVFRGVPFAAPPVGDRRFRPPEPPVPWKEVRDATRFSAIPPQAADPLTRTLGLASDLPCDEDCLYLNVYSVGVEATSVGVEATSVGAEATSVGAEATGPGRAALRPVLVWLHGGAFLSGTGNVPLYDGSRLAERGDVVVVTLNYRVGALGFLYVDALSGGSGGATANLGLQDQMAALRWVRENIDRFGGDPGRVTVFGESAGAGSIVSLLAMPSASGLFRRAIVQSAAPEGMIAPEEAARRAEKLVGMLDLPTPSVESLRSVSLAQLQDAQQRCAADGPYDKGMLFTPVVDGSLLPVMPMEAIRSGSARDVELIIGTTREEMSLYRMKNASGPTLSTEIGDELLEKIFAAQLPGQTAEGRTRASLLIEKYCAIRSERGSAATANDLFYAIQTDIALRRPATELAEAHARIQPNTYMYLFTWASPFQNGELEACHALDLPFAFGTLDAPGIAAFAGSGSAARRLSENMMEAWLSFACCGDPAHPGIGPWPRYDAKRRATMLFGEMSGAEDAPLESERAVWDQVR